MNDNTKTAAAEAMAAGHNATHNQEYMTAAILYEAAFRLYNLVKCQASWNDDHHEAEITGALVTMALRNKRDAEHLAELTNCEA
jgi:hypothetical protein